MSFDHDRSPASLDCIAAFSPEVKRWVQDARERGSANLGQADFPTRQIETLAQIEQQTDVHRIHPLEYFVALAYGCLTTAFIMTQRHAAIRRIETSPNPRSSAEWLPVIVKGQAFATVGISHLTTSRRHLATPPVTLRWSGEDGFLNGSIPWVTGAPQAQYIVAGAVDADDSNQQYLILLELPSEGVRPGPGMPLVALTSSCTDVVDLSEARIHRRDVLHGPHENAMAASNTGGAGGLQTSALALGLAASAMEYLMAESPHRPALEAHAVNLLAQWSELYGLLISSQRAPDPNRLRKDANDLALHATQAALSAAKGAGFVEGHPVGRWCREALFFLVWSCPQMVADAHLCSFSGWRT
ncbi:MAG: acyl-CoA dehydrogenase [Planctomycetota bacterium]|jgi:alkylation response protein AidB-like acyl-CoA dehydrogenase